MLTLTIPGVPPSVNHYAKHTRSGKHYQTSQARQFKHDVAVLARGKKVQAERWLVEYQVFLGKGGRGDADNFAKVILDALSKAGVIGNDAFAIPVPRFNGRDWDNPRTVITIYDADKFHNPVLGIGREK